MALLGLECSSEGLVERDASVARNDLEASAGQSSSPTSLAAGSAGRDARGSAGTTGADEQAVSNYAWINEAKIDPPGTDGDYEFVEILGQPATSLAGYWLLSIEGDKESNRGQIDKVIDLSDCGSDGPCRFDAHGLLLLVADNKITVPPDGAALRQSSELHNGGLENGTNSLLLVAGPLSSRIGVDLDADDDGQLELPTDLTVIDAVAWTDGDVGDVPYTSNPLGPKPKPQAIWSCIDDAGNRTWQLGQLLGSSESIAVDPAHRSPPDDVAQELSPGAPNACRITSLTLPESQMGGAAGAVSGSTASPTTTAGCGEIPNAGTDPLSVGAGGVAVAESTGSVGGSTKASTLAPSLSTAIAATAGCANAAQSASTNSSGGGRANAAASASTNPNAGGRSFTSSAVAPPSSGGGVGGTATQTNSTTGRAGVGQVVARASAESAAGTLGWWSPDPFSTPNEGGVSMGLGVALAGSSSARTGAASASAPPELGTCAFSSRPRNRHTPGILAAILLAGLAVCRRTFRDRS